MTLEIFNVGKPLKSIYKTNNTSCPVSLHSCATCLGFKHVNIQLRLKPAPAGSTLSPPEILTTVPLQPPTEDAVKEDGHKKMKLLSYRNKIHTITLLRF